MSGVVALGATEFSASETIGTFLVPIVRTGDLSTPATVSYATTADTAAAGSDFTSISGSVQMAAGVDRVVVPVTIVNDAASEATEAFVFSITTVANATLNAPRTARINILDDENPVVDPVDPPLTSAFNVRMIDVKTGLTTPIAMEFSKVDPNTLYIAEKGGVIKAANLSTGAEQVVIDISAKVNNKQDRGLLDIALHPDLANNPYLYAFYVVDPPQSAGNPNANAAQDGGGNRFSYVSRFTLDAATGYKTVVAGSEVVLLGGAGQNLSDISGGGQVDSTDNLTIADSELLPSGAFRQDYLKVDSLSHAGGSIEFGPDGALYVSTGDGASFNTVDPRAVSVQNVNSLSGKVLRVNPLNGDGFADNPYYVAGSSLDLNASKVWQLGLRNPFSMSFDKAGQLITTDTGWNTYEEVNIGGRGANFGWPYFEGGDNGVSLRTGQYENLPSAAVFYNSVSSGAIKIVAPFRGFGHANAVPGFQVQAIVGSDDVITSNVYPALFQNDYIFSDYVQGEIFSVDVNDPRAVTFLTKTASGLGPVHYKQGPDGFIYYTEIFSGKIGRFEIGELGGPAPVLKGAFKADYYSIAGTTSALSQINFNATPIFTENLTTVLENGGAAAFYSGGPVNNFAVRYAATFEVVQAGTYVFYVASDDGARLFIDGREIINNDGLHATVELSGVASLSSGSHTLELRYFEAGGDAILDLDWSGPSFARAQMTFDGQVAPPPPPPPPTGSNVVNDVPNVTQYVTGSAALTDIFVINGNSESYNVNLTDDGQDHVVWGATGFDLLYDWDQIRFNDRTVNLTISPPPPPPPPPSGNVVNDVSNVTQYVRGTASVTDTFVINGNSTAYGWGATADGQDHVVWGPTGFDLLYDWDQIRFNDRTIILA
jgi:glucose/arabinose dehydrogenase